MNCKAVFCLVIFLLTGCAARQEAASTRDPSQLITGEEYGDLKIKPPAEKPVYVDYAKEGTYRQSIETLKKVDGTKDSQHRFIEVAASAPVDELRVLHENGAEVNFRNDTGETVLLKVLEGPYNEETVAKLAYLISAGAKLNFRGRSATSPYTTPLGVAIWNSSAVFNSGKAVNYPSAKKALALLIEEGAAISGLDTGGRTPLHVAAEADNLFAAELLLEAGAQVAAEDDEGRTPLDLAASGDMINLLTESGTEVLPGGQI